MSGRIPAARLQVWGPRCPVLFWKALWGLDWIDQLQISRPDPRTILITTFAPIAAIRASTARSSGAPAAFVRNTPQAIQAGSLQERLREAWDLNAEVQTTDQRNPIGEAFDFIQMGFQFENTLRSYGFLLDATPGGARCNAWSRRKTGSRLRNPWFYICDIAGS